MYEALQQILKELTHDAAKTIPNGIHSLSMRWTIGCCQLNHLERQGTRKTCILSGYWWAEFWSHEYVVSVEPPGEVTIHVENVDEFKWLNSSYGPVLRQLESASVKVLYFNQRYPSTLSSGSSNLKYRNPKYLSMLNHLRFIPSQIRYCFLMMILLYRKTWLHHGQWISMGRWMVQYSVAKNADEGIGS